MRDKQASLDLGGKPIAGDILDRIRNESRDQAEKGRWFEQLFMRLAPAEVFSDQTSPEGSSTAQAAGQV